MKNKHTILKNTGKFKTPLLIGTPTLGIVRYEWSARRYGQVIPINWHASDIAIAHAPMGYHVADAYNLIVEHGVKHKVEWLVTWEDDVMPPENVFVLLRPYIQKGNVPIVSGLYYTKSDPAEPLLFRGRGNGAFHGWKLGEKVWVDGIPMGLMLCHFSILEYMYENSEEYRLSDGRVTRKVFDTPRMKYFDPETLQWGMEGGTQDLFWCDRVIKEEVLQKTGWKRIARRQYPFLCDTNIFCRHIDLNSGKMYP